MNYVLELRKLVGNRPLILPGAVVLIVNEKHELLLQLRHDGEWGLPGGLMELGESTEETAKREVLEETGLIVDDLKLLGVFSGNDFYIKVSNGDEVYSVTIVYMTNKFKGALEIDGVETMSLQFFSLNQLPENIQRGNKKMIAPYLAEMNGLK